MQIKIILSYHQLGKIKIFKNMQTHNTQKKKIQNCKNKTVRNQKGHQQVDILKTMAWEFPGGSVG